MKAAKSELPQCVSPTKREKHGTQQVPSDDEKKS